jgi:hypothetical protein
LFRTKLDLVLAQDLFVDLHGEKYILNRMFPKILHTHLQNKGTIPADYRILKGYTAYGNVTLSLSSNPEKLPLQFILPALF